MTKEKTPGVTPADMPCFHINAQLYREDEGIVTAQIGFISSHFPQRAEDGELFYAGMPDQVAIFARDDRPKEERTITAGGESSTNEYRVSVFQTMIFAAQNGGLCFRGTGGKTWLLPPTALVADLPSSEGKSEARPFTAWRDAIKARNENYYKTATPPDLADVAAMPLPETPSAKNATETVTEFSFQTSQEFNALSLAQCDGKTFAGYMMNEQAGAIIHYRAGSPHQIRMELSEDERTAGLALGYLENLARAQDADAVLATAYILGVLAPPSHLPPRPYAGGWIDFDDVLSKIGWIPRNTKDRRELHGKIWNFVKFGERAQIIGKRTGAKYKDAEGNEIDTTIHGAAWRVMKTETPDPPALYAALETPVRAEIVVSKELTALISNPKTAQYFQCGEVLGAIPGGKPAGAWARVIGLALLSFWRRKPREYDAGILKPTRRELLSHYAAKIAPYDEILASDKPGRAIDYWHGALQILADEGFIARTGEAAITPKAMRDGLPRKNWQDLWLDQSINIEVGTKTKPAFEKVLKSQFALKPRDLKKKPRAKKPTKSRQQTGGM